MKRTKDRFGKFEYYNDHNLESDVKRKSAIIEKFLNERIASLDERITIRGIGFIWGIDLNAIDSKLAVECVHKAFDNGLILEVAGRHDGVLKVMPPLTIEDNILLEGLEILEKTVKEALKK